MMRRVMLCLAPLLLSCGCGTGWQYLKVDNVSYRDLYNLTAHIIDSEGFVLDKQDTNEGLITTQWDYNKLVDRGRFPIRRMVEAHIDPGDEGYQIRIRIKQQALWESYGVSNPKTAKGWDPYGQDKETTQNILTRINLIVKEFKVSDEFLERERRAERLKASLPDVLKSKSGDGEVDR